MDCNIVTKDVSSGLFRQISVLKLFTVFSLSPILICVLHRSNLNWFYNISKISRRVTANFLHDSVPFFFLSLFEIISYGPFSQPPSIAEFWSNIFNVQFIPIFELSRRQNLIKSLSDRLPRPIVKVLQRFRNCLRPHIHGATDGLVHELPHLDTGVCPRRFYWTSIWISVVIVSSFMFF